MDETIRQLSQSSSGFNGFDWIIVIAVAISMLVGVWRGFAREALSLLGWACAFIGANVLAQSLAQSFVGVFDSPTLRYLLGWALVFVGVLAIFSVLGSLLAKQLGQPGFNLGNRFLGGVFGIGRGFVIMMEELPRERLGIAAQAVAASEGALNITAQYVQEREAFGQKIGQFQNTRFKSPLQDILYIHILFDRIRMEFALHVGVIELGDALEQEGGDPSAHILG